MVRKYLKNNYLSSINGENFIRFLYFSLIHVVIEAENIIVYFDFADNNELMESEKRKKTSDDGQSPEQTTKKKKARTTFTGRQIFELEKQFEQKKYLSSAERAEMATLLNVTETQVNIFLFVCLFVLRPS